MTITDKETQAPAGMLIVAHQTAHHWKANETYFLQAIGDQMLMSVSHTRLRSLGSPHGRFRRPHRVAEQDVVCGMPVE